MEGYLTVESAKIAAIQDSGRLGYEHYGICDNGAVDMYAYLAGNALVGNATAQPAIEITAFDFDMTSTIDIPICITGAPADLKINSDPVQPWSTLLLPAGKVLSVSHIRKGLRVYIAIGGGIDAPKVLGSCALDTIINLGKRLVSGQKLRLKNEDAAKSIQCRIANPEVIPHYGSPWNIRVCDGPDIEIFKDSFTGFYEATYKISPVSNHIGIRLSGPPVKKFYPKEILSRGVGIGSIEVFPTGQAVVLHRGRTVTAGYPIIGVVPLIDLDMIGQARPGDEVHFSHLSIKEAKKLYYDRFSRLPYRR
ncbi:biotin-dependent carboxyltransferase family protein [Sporolactobacillus pectinivorans]|uniref:5-oxoprolinase subunit C family protein n=1 Tax=Sporolactobacillus pectinivorans TaxID=1591408 RepID=UPI000C26581C|nr:biotin-dependent carboxyltransferase family protein [Sporolactobacillus pectinivorans]